MGITSRLAGLGGALAAVSLLALAPHSLADQPGATTGNTVARAPAGKELNLLQVNLCRSGKAGCWTAGGVDDEGSSLHSLVKTVGALADEGAGPPDFITVEEGCSQDIGVTSDVKGSVLHKLKERFGLDYQRAWQAEGDTSGGGDPEKYQCVRGSGDNTPERGTFGVGVLSLTKRVGDKGDVRRDLYPAGMQTSSKEWRAYMCADYGGGARPGAVTACVTHLALARGDDGARDQHEQCDFLKKQLTRKDQPTVFGGDLNMTYGGTPNDAQQCVPPGFVRKGDGDVQHLMASNDLAFPAKVRTGPLPGSDHEWLLARLS